MSRRGLVGLIGAVGLGSKVNAEAICDIYLPRGAQWPRGQCARRAIAEAKQRSQ
jgi:hypothetical protein